MSAPIPEDAQRLADVQRSARSRRGRVMTTPAMTSDCSNCEGTGVVGDASYWNPEAAWSDNCPACDGRGTVPDPVAVGDAAVAAAGIRALIHADSGRLDNWSHQ